MYTPAASEGKSSNQWVLPMLGRALACALIAVGSASLYHQHTRATSWLTKIKLEGAFAMTAGGVVSLVGISWLIKRNRGNQAEGSRNQANAQHVQQAAVARPGQEAPRAVSITQALTEAVKECATRNAVTDHIVHFHTIFSHEKAKLVLGNDRTRELILQKTDNRMNVLRGGYDRLAQENGTPSIYTQQIDEGLDDLTKVDLLISLNGNVHKDGRGISPHPEIVGVAEFNHIQHPISQINEAYEPALDANQLRVIFKEIDEALNKEKTVFIHCNQGQHRSATIMVLYIASRTGCSFDDVHKFVSAKRDIKKYTGNSVNLMTTAYKKGPEFLRELAT